MKKQKHYIKSSKQYNINKSIKKKKQCPFPPTQYACRNVV